MNKLVKTILCIGLFPVSSIFNNTYCAKQIPNEKSKFLIDKKLDIKRRKKNIFRVVTRIRTNPFRIDYFSVSKADKSDFYDIINTYNKCFSKPLNPDIFNLYIEEGFAYKLVKNNNENVAYAMIWTEERSNFVEIDLFFVNPKYQGQKDGSHFLRKMLAIISLKYPNKKVTLCSSDAGLKLYNKVMTVDPEDKYIFHYSKNKNS